MNKEKSCGAVVFTREADGVIRYVLVEQRSGNYCFPKGHVENGETEHQTALREIWEETGLRPEFIEGFRESETYEVVKKPGTMKDVFYFLAEFSGQPICPPPTDEIREVRLCTFAEALELLPTESRKSILIKANAFLTGCPALSNRSGLMIRTANMDDLDALTAVEAECFPPSEAATRSEFAQRLAYYANHFWLMFDGEKLISFVDGFCTDEPDLTDEMFADASMHNENGDWQMIFGVNTIPAYRNHGYAGELIRAAIADAGSRGRKGLVLTCKEAKIRWYAGFGFEDEGLSRSVHGGVPWHQMRLTFRKCEE